MSGVGRYENDDRPAKLRRLGRGPAQLTHSPLNTPQLSVSTDATLTLRTHGSDNTSDREEPNHAMEPRGSTLNVGEDLIGSATASEFRTLFHVRLGNRVAYYEVFFRRLRRLLTLWSDVVALILHYRSIWVPAVTSHAGEEDFAIFTEVHCAGVLG